MMNKIADYTRGVDYDFFFRHPMMVDAVIRNLEVIGEASKNVSEEIRGKYGDSMEEDDWSIAFLTYPCV